jgi:hypothetical protein
VEWRAKRFSISQQQQVTGMGLCCNAQIVLKALLFGAIITAQADRSTRTMFSAAVATVIPYLLLLLLSFILMSYPIATDKTSPDGDVGSSYILFQQGEAMP